MQVYNSSMLQAHNREIVSTFACCVLHRQRQCIYHCSRESLGGPQHCCSMSARCRNLHRIANKSRRREEWEDEEDEEAKRK